MVAITDMVTATTAVSVLLKNARKSISIPTLIKKNGMKMEFPTKSMRFMSGEVRGIKRLSASPARNAPMMASIPAIIDITAPRNTIASTKIYWVTLSLKRLKNHRAITGKMNKMMRVNRIKNPVSLIQKKWSISPLVIPTITARTKSARILVINVLPTVILTAWFLAMPSLLTMG